MCERAVCVCVRTRYLHLLPQLPQLLKRFIEKTELGKGVFVVNNPAHCVSECVHHVCLTNQLARRRPFSPTNLSCSRKVSARLYYYFYFTAVPTFQLKVDFFPILFLI